MITLNTDMPLLNAALTAGISDLHLHARRPAHWRFLGDLIPTDPAAEGLSTLQALISLLELNGRPMPAIGKVDFGFNYKGRRFRASFYKTMGELAGVLRLIPNRHWSLNEIGVPATFTSVLNEHRGLILVSGATGDGKSTTLAAAVSYLSTRLRGKIITLEDPVEYLHSDKNAIVDQLELGSDFTHFNAALEGALRQDPDVILVGELRDFATFETACHAATTGHLVLASVHGESATKTIARIVDTFPETVRAEQRARFAQVLSAIYCQQLVKTNQGTRIAIGELMITTEAIRIHIRDNRLDYIPGEIRSGSKFGMRSMDMHLAQLVRAKAVAEADARSRCLYPDQFSQLLSFTP
jgi:twitching motility protein PilT